MPDRFHTIRARLEAAKARLKAVADLEEYERRGRNALVAEWGAEKYVTRMTALKAAVEGWDLRAEVAGLIVVGEDLLSAYAEVRAQLEPVAERRAS